MIEISKLRKKILILYTISLVFQFFIANNFFMEKRFSPLFIFYIFYGLVYFFYILKNKKQLMEESIFYIFLYQAILFLILYIISLIFAM